MPNRDTNAKTNIAILMDEMREEVYHSLLFSPFIGEAKVEWEFKDGKPTKRILMSGNVVEKITDWSSMTRGRWADSIEYPQLKRLSGLPAYGDSWIEKTGEDLDYRWSKCFINLMSKNVMNKRGDMDKLRDEDIYNLLNNSKPELTLWLMRQLNAQAISSIYDSASSNVTAGTSVAPNGIGLKKILHPNIYRWTTSIAPVGTEYQPKTVAQLDTAGLYSSDLAIISTTALIHLKKKLRKEMFMPNAPYKGAKYYLIVVSDDEITNLMLEQTFRETCQRADMGYGQNSSYMTSPEVWIWSDFLILVDSLAVRKWAVGYGFKGANEEGYADLPTTGLTDHNFCIVLGKSALVHAVEKEVNMKFVSRDYNMGGMQETAVKHVFGWGRIEHVDEDDMESYWIKGQASESYMETAIDVYNKSSMLVIFKASA